MKKKTRSCPYCGSKVSYIRSLTEISSGEHLCRDCGRYSSVTYDKKIYISAGLLLLAAVILAAVMFFSDFSKQILLKFAVIIIPFGIFFFMIPLYYRLVSIKSEAAKPSVQLRKRSEAKEKTKYIKHNGDNVQTEEREELSSNGSFKDKFHKFVKTYIIVDDEEDDADVKPAKKKEPPKKEKKKRFDDEFGSFDDDVIIDEVYEENNEENVQIENIDIENDFIEEDYIEEDSIEEQKEKITENKSEDDDDDDVIIIEDNNEDMSAFKRPQTAVTENNAQKNETHEDEKQTDELKQEAFVPVYHKYTKTNKVDYIYFAPEKDIDTVLYSMMKDPEPEIDEEEMENEEILNFFDSELSAEEEKEFGGSDIHKVEYTFGERKEISDDVAEPDSTSDNEDEPEKDNENEIEEEIADNAEDEIEEDIADDVDDEIEEDFEDDYIEFEYNPEDQNTINIDNSTDIAEEAAFSESADDEEDVVAETPEMISDENSVDVDEDEGELEFDFGEEEDDPKSVSPENILSYSEELEVTGDPEKIEVLTQDDVSEDESRAEKKLISVIKPAVLEDEYDNANDAIEFGKMFDEVFDYDPHNKIENLGSDDDDKNMKLVDSSDSEKEENTVESDVVSEDEIDTELTEKNDQTEENNNELTVDEEQTDVVSDEENDKELDEEDDLSENISDDEEDTETYEDDDDSGYVLDEDDDIFEEDDVEPTEGAIEYIPEEKSLEKTKVFSKIETEDDYVVDYSEENVKKEENTEKYDDVFEDDDDEEIDFSGYQTSSYTEEEPEEETVEETEVKTESKAAKKSDKTEKAVKVSAEKKEEPVKSKPSKYEKKFPKAAQAAAAMSQKKPVKEPVKEPVLTENAEPEKEEQKKPVQKKAVSGKRKKKKSKSKSKGFFSAIKEKIVEATEEERKEAFEQEEEVRRQAEKEARRKAKEKAKAEKDRINAENAKKK